jgi:hypothetical protein
VEEKTQKIGQLESELIKSEAELKEAKENAAKVKNYFLFSLIPIFYKHWLISVLYF